MPKTITSTEAQAQFGAILKWTRENNDEVVVKLYGEPAAVLIPYAEYEKIERLRKQEAGRRALGALDAIRREVRKSNPDLTAAEAYRQAGFSEEIVQETLRKDQALSTSEQ